MSPGVTCGRPVGCELELYVDIGCGGVALSSMGSTLRVVLSPPAMSRVSWTSETNKQLKMYHMRKIKQNLSYTDNQLFRSFRIFSMAGSLSKPKPVCDKFYCTYRKTSLSWPIRKEDPF